MMELLWLLLPVAAFSGWMAARRSGNRHEARRDERAPIYFRGLNFLLNEQPDKAIDVFVEMLEVDSETVETHLALGNLFRRRGEVDRAIRIHQNLIARPTLSREQRGLALLELGQDYMRAGLHDRAESLFKELGDLNIHQQPALENLLLIYQKEREWQKCLDVVRQLEALSRRSYAMERAHYYCELAQQARGRHDMKQAELLLRKAQGSDPACVRASLMQADLAAARGGCKSAIAAYRKVAGQDPAFIGEMLPALIVCHQQEGTQRELLDYLQGLSRKHQGVIAPVLALVDQLGEQQGRERAREYLGDYLGKHPDLRGVARLIELDLQRSAASDQEPLRLLGNIVAKLLAAGPAYLCGNCGFTAKSLHWQCPGCMSWSTIKPITGLVEEPR
ncbi:MAG: lipopolysaccharide assembly protein LapB [Candidatus Sedimenticola endophacoides]|uniref:Lipopolysaccharide assembly protein B n=1 Tax=Candidatus Sedimenticola endophacoides TaxID=2548426 RepID=A0A6N4E1D4_9GAMM|nr:MAG: lipopolysaccharide assembly protein LapB [Candidatus Sedimenticola endophacoides]PUE02688.1 MAG: lipopolysaccharide assembly protein LapB [Candidatus Sedimenticola endophacoides]PUE04649.1 MAG: lipopolysaccharide assembly protein LapB [Candidatus Sedimenticola endophacoides]